jgi:hypothetical protein
MTKGERFIKCREQRHDSRGRRCMVPGGAELSDVEDKGKFIIYRGKRHGSRGSMSDMISVLHHSVAINAKRGDFLLRLVVIDVNP